MKHIFSLLALCTLFAATLNAQTEVATYHPGVTTDGITYFLPKTNIRLAITATKTHHEPGEYSQYAKRFLRLDDATQTAYDEWKITDISLMPYGTADTEKAYTIKFKTKTSAPLVGLSNDGCLLSVNTDAPEAKPLTEPSVVRGTTTKVDAANYKTQEILSAGSTAKMAELAANEIYDIRENRGLLAKGQADFMPKDGEQLRLMLANLDAQENGLLQLFTGWSETETRTFVFDLTPTQEVSKQVILRFSKYLGIVDNDDPAGEPIYLTLTDLKTVPEETVDPKAKPKKEVEDLRYCVPGRVKVTLSSTSGELLTQTIAMAQFGRVEHLGGELFNKKFTTRLTLYPETGGIAKIEGQEQ